MYVSLWIFGHHPRLSNSWELLAISFMTETCRMACCPSKCLRGVTQGTKTENDPVTIDLIPDCESCFALFTARYQGWNFNVSNLTEGSCQTGALGPQVHHCSRPSGWREEDTASICCMLELTTKNDQIHPESKLKQLNAPAKRTFNEFKNRSHLSLSIQFNKKVWYRSFAVYLM